LSKKFTKRDPPVVIKALSLDVILSYESSLAVYTDGSKDLSGKVGSAVYIPEVEEQLCVRISDKLSVYTSELYAILLTLQWIIDNESCDSLANNRSVVIFSDSLSTLVSLEQGRSSSRPNLLNDAIALYNVLRNRSITFVWVPSHVGIHGNEVADCIAKRALEQPSVDRRVTFECREVHEQINSYVDTLWQKKWDKNW